MDLVYRTDGGGLAGLPRTTQGGIIIPATLTRTGVFTYYRTDGTKVREYRSPEEVFDPESLATLRAATVTVGHPAEVTSANWRGVTVGHVDEEGRRDGNFVAAPVRVLDRGTIERIDRKELSEISAGYATKLDETPGVSPEGEAYDVRQTKIRYNHVALLPAGTGRAGPDVRLRLDSIGHEVLSGDDPSGSKTVPTATKTDGFTMTLEEALKKIGELEAAAKLRTDAADADRAKVELLQGKVQELTVKLDAADKAAQDTKALDARVAARVELVSAAKLHLDTKEAPYVAAGKSDRDIRVELLARVAPSFKCDGKTDEALSATLDYALTMNAGARKAAGEVVVTVPGLVPGTRADATDDPYTRNVNASIKAHEVAPPSRIGAK